MPDILRQPLRFDCKGIDLAHPVDRIPDGYFPYLQNCRVIVEGRIESRPGYTPFNPTATTTKQLHSIRRLNDPDLSITPFGYTYVVGNGGTLMAGIETLLTQIDTGFSGNPLSLINFRPEQSPEAWTYVYDQNKLVKVNAANTVRAVGVAPPTDAPYIEYGIPAFVEVADAQTAAGWTNSGAASAVSTQDRANGSGPTIGGIIYDHPSNTGWCCIAPSTVSTDVSWVGERMRIVLNAGNPNEESPVVREVHAAIGPTGVTSIFYDDPGTNIGFCSIVLANSPTNLERNSLIVVGGEVLRVFEVVPAPDGVTYSIRVFTATTRSSGDTVTGLVSWYVYTSFSHNAGEAIETHYVAVTQGGAGTGAVQRLGLVNSGVANGRPVSLADDYLHFSLFLVAPGVVTSLTVLIDLDPGTPSGTPFTRNYIEWDIPIAQIGSFGASSANVWADVTVPLSQGVRHGNDLTLNLTTARATGLKLVSTAACDWGFDWLYNFGTYGSTVQPNAPTGDYYQARFRDSSTGAASVPGPFSRSQLFPLREAVIVTPTPSTQTGVDVIDVYRNGGTLTDFTFVGTLANAFVVPFLDTFSDTDIQGNPAPDLTLLQPWPLLGLAWSGTVDVSGTSVRRVSGTPFDPALLSNSIISIGGFVYQTYGQPRNINFLELTQSAGAQVNVAFKVASPTLAGQPLPFAFGPLEGPLAPVVFALGDAVNGGNLYYSNTSDADSASDRNNVELTAHSEPLISGDVWNGLVICGSRDNIFLVRYAYLQTNQYQFSRIPSASGMWSRWSCCRGPNGIYFLGRDGIYLASESQSICITDDQLYPVFPHDGQPANTAGVNGIWPVDMTLTQQLRLSCADRDIYFDYIDILGNAVCLRYEIDKKRWFPHFYAEAGGMSTHYLVELPAGSPDRQELLLLARGTGFVNISGGNTDNGADINSVMQTPSSDGGDERAQKLYVDQMIDADGTGTLAFATYFDNEASNNPVVNLTLTGVRQQFTPVIDSLADLSLHRNISCRFAWTGGPAGPRLYAYEPSGYIQPYLSTSIITQFLNLSFQGWKHSRRLFPGIISTAAVSFSIWTDDGRQYGPFTIPSTGGRYRIQPQMLPPIKGLAMAYSVTSTAPFAFFPDSFSLETKEWVEPDYLRLAVFKT